MSRTGLAGIRHKLKNENRFERNNIIHELLSKNLMHESLAYFGVCKYSFGIFFLTKMKLNVQKQQLALTDDSSI